MNYIERQLNEIKKTRQEQNEKFTREIEIIKKELNRNPGAEEYCKWYEKCDSINSRLEKEE